MSLNQENVYNKIAEDVDPILLNILKETINKLAKEPHQNLLDVGCGYGKLLSFFVRFQNCYGVDFSEGPLSKAKSRGINTYRVNLENERIPFQSNFFDLVICSQVIEHVLNTDSLLNEINRVLRDKGTLILTFPNINQPVSWLAQIIFDYPPMFAARYKSTHVRDYTLRIVKKILPIYGFDIYNIRGTCIYPFKSNFSQWLAKITPRISQRIIVLSLKKRKPEKTLNVVGDLRFF